MSLSPLLVTGASGHLGRRVLELLLDQGAGPLIATTRTPASLASFAARGVDVRQADFDDEAGLVRAFAGANRALLVSTDALDRPGRRLEQHQRAIRALEAAGVEQVVYTSVANAATSTLAVAPDHLGTETALAASRLDYTILGNNLYAELLLGSLPGAAASGQLVNATGTGAVAYVTREDCARAAAAAVSVRTPGRRVVQVTGPEALTGADLAALLGELVGKPIAHVSVPVDALIQGMVQHGLPQPVAEIYASFDVSTAKGELQEISDGLVRLTGRPPQSVRAFLVANRAALAAA
ncbi:MAG: SDR family oxidoreductase [Pseudomonadota bacterium]|nr:SDR family oxidoreductase [Pseudomonadota bacterium]